MWPFKLATVPVPPPPPPTLSLKWWTALVTSIIAFAVTLPGLISLCLGFVYYLVRKYRRWKEKTIEKAFYKTDLDGSGRVNPDELYIGVCETYLELHAYGLNVRAPKRENVIKLLKLHDHDKTGELDLPEFKTLVRRLLAAQAGRIASQVGLTVLCPITAGFVCAWIRAGFINSCGYFGIALPPFESLPEYLQQLPSTLDETIVCGIMMMAVHPALAFVDYVAEQSKPPSTKEAITYVMGTPQKQKAEKAQTEQKAAQKKL